MLCLSAGNDTSGMFRTVIIGVSVKSMSKEVLQVSAVLLVLVEMCMYVCCGGGHVSMWYLKSHIHRM